MSWLNCFRRAAVSKPQEYENTDPREFYITSEALDAEQEYVHKFRDALDECCKVILDEREMTGRARLVTNEVIATAFYRVTNNIDAALGKGDADGGQLSQPNESEVQR